MSFIKYLIGTESCHTARRLSECQRADLYYSYKCNEMKALNYALFYQLPSCLENIKGGNYIFSLYNKFCGAAESRSTNLITLNETVTTTTGTEVGL